MLTKASFKRQNCNSLVEHKDELLKSDKTWAAQKYILNNKSARILSIDFDYYKKKIMTI